MTPSEPPAPLFRIASVGKSFAGIAVLEGVSFSADRGEIVMLVGENGAGKSTLKNILSGLVAPDAGEVDFAGRMLAALSPADADRFGIGTIHQELSPFENLSVAENIHLPLNGVRGLITHPHACKLASLTVAWMRFTADPCITLARRRAIERKSDADGLGLRGAIGPRPARPSSSGSGHGCR